MIKIKIIAIKKGGTGGGTLSETKKRSEKVKRRKRKMKERRKREEHLIFVINIMCKGLSSNLRKIECFLK